MVNKQVNICDSCNKRTAESKCSICGDDLCTPCKRHSFNLLIMSKDITTTIGEISFCKKCKTKLKDKLDIKNLFDLEFADKITKDIGGYLVKKMLVESL